ncbi:MAG: hypothetical protein AAGA29_08840 [Planctomycetota bacterium]
MMLFSGMEALLMTYSMDLRERVINKASMPENNIMTDGDQSRQLL